MVEREGPNPEEQNSPEELALEKPPPSPEEDASEEPSVRERASRVKRWTRGLTELGLVLGIALHFEAAKPWEKPDAEQPRPADTIESMERDYLDQIYGDAYSLGESRGDEAAAAFLQARETTLEGVSEVKGVDNEDLDSLTVRKLFLGTFPKGWTDRLHIRFRPGVTESIPDVYGINGTVAGDYDARTRTVQLFETGVVQELETYAHEIGHANDWQSDRATPAQRADLLYRVTQRYLSGDHLYQSEYVDSIHNPTANIELYRKVLEYYAEITMAYFTQNSELHRNNPKDWELVHLEVASQDPRYDATQESNERSFIAEMPREGRVMEAILAQRPDLFDLPNVGKLRASGLEAPAKKIIEREGEKWKQSQELERDRKYSATLEGIPGEAMEDILQARSDALPGYNQLGEELLPLEKIEDVRQKEREYELKLKAELSPVCERYGINTDAEVDRTVEWMMLQHLSPPYGYKTAESNGEHE